MSYPRVCILGCSGASFIRPALVFSVVVSKRFPSQQELNETVGGKLEEYIHAINGCYPPEIVEYYSPEYSKTLLDKIDEFQPMVV